MTTLLVIALATLKVAAWVIPAALAAWLFVGAYLLDHKENGATNQEEL